MKVPEKSGRMNIDGWNAFSVWLPDVIFGLLVWAIMMRVYVLSLDLEGGNTLFDSATTMTMIPTSCSQTYTIGGRGIDRTRCKRSSVCSASVHTLTLVCLDLRSEARHPLDPLLPILSDAQQFPPRSEYGTHLNEDV